MTVADNTIQNPSYPTVALHSTYLHKHHASNYDIVIQLVGNRQRHRVPFHAEFTVSRVRNKVKVNDPTVITLANGTKLVQIPRRISDQYTAQCAIREGLKLADAKANSKIALDIRKMPRQRIEMQNALYSSMSFLGSLSSGSEQNISTINIYGTAGRHFANLPKASAQANILSSWLCIQPSDVLNPKTLVEFCRDQAKLHDLDFDFINTKKLAKMKAGAFLATVGENSKGGIVKISYTGYAHKKRNKYALIGKAVCHSNKEAKNDTLDIAGATAALSAVIQAKKLHLKHSVDAWLLIAENLDGAKNLKLGDIAAAQDNTTVEITQPNNDGTLMLADGICIAAKDQPSAIATFSTATKKANSDTEIGGVFGNKHLVETAMHSSKLSGEKFNNVKTPDDYLINFKSPKADIAQGLENNQDSEILESLFLQKFTSNTPWIHLDLSPSLRSQAFDKIGFGANWAINWLFFNSVK